MLTFTLTWQAVCIAATCLRTPGTGKHRARRRWL